MTTADIQKLQNCIIDCVKLISLHFKNYIDIANICKKHVSGTIAHRTTLRNVEEAKIENTELFKIEPDIKLKFQNTIQEELISEEIASDKLLNDLKKSYSLINAQLDKICDTAKNCNLSTDDLIMRTEMCLSFAEMLEAVNDFRRFFRDDHNSRKYSVDEMHYTENPEIFLNS